jgi:hypothetical protein
MADVQIAVGLWWKARVDPLEPSGFQVLHDRGADKVRRKLVELLVG